MLNGWFKIYTSTNPIKVEIIKHMLKENNIDSVIINKQDSSYNMFGNIELYTKKTNHKLAIELIKQKGNG